MDLGQLGNFFNSIFSGIPNTWSGGMAHSFIILALVIALGKIIGRIKIAGISFGVTWVLFIGLIFSHFGMTLDNNLLHFIKEFGLVLFVYSIGLQVGPGFFSSLRSGGLKLNLLAFIVICLGVGTTLAIYFITGTSATTITGIMSGAVTNTPGLGAAQQAYFDTFGTDAPNLASAYAVAYPLGVLGCILCFVFIKNIFYRRFVAAPPVINSSKISLSPNPESQSNKEKAGNLNSGSKFISRRIIISKRKLNGIFISDLGFDKLDDASITRIRRAGIEIKATLHTRLQYGDQVTVVGSEEAIAAIEKVLGNSRKRLDEPNLIPIFMGIAIGCLLGSIPIKFPGIPLPVKLGLAGGPLIASIFFSHFGPRFNVITYTTASANLMLREIGISLFLASVGLEAGSGFIDTILHKGGYVWIAYGAIITIIPVILSGVIGRFVMKLSYPTLVGVLSGSCTNPPALAYSEDQNKDSNETAVGYATVYPLSLFFRVLLAQLLILLLAT